MIRLKDMTMWLLLSLLSGLLSRLFARHAGINGFVRTRTRLLQKQEDVPWPMTPGNRYLI